MREMKNKKRDRWYQWVIVSGFLVIVILMSILCIQLQSIRTLLFGLTVIAAALLIAVVAMVSGYTKRVLLSKLERLLREEIEQPEDQEMFRHLNSEEILEEIESRFQMTSLTETLKTEAELHALQNQINPHFLYNTLEIIRSRAMVQGNADVAEMVEALALQFRYCINNLGEMATLEQELENVHNYLLIQRYRYGDRFAYHEIINDEQGNLMSNRLPVMTLQPLIENALVHGVNPRIEGGNITLRIDTSKHRLHIIIEDDGVGIPEDELQKVRQTLQINKEVEYKRIKGKRSLGVAMGNVNQRIRLYFGREYGVDIISTRGMGTSVYVTLPLNGAGR